MWSVVFNQFFFQDKDETDHHSGLKNTESPPRPESRIGPLDGAYMDSADNTDTALQEQGFHSHPHSLVISSEPKLVLNQLDSNHLQRYATAIP